MRLVGVEKQNKLSFINISEIMASTLTLEFLEMCSLLTILLSFSDCQLETELPTTEWVFANVIQEH